ncbi:MAG TPA: hypothetical protein VJC03_06620, partial [bacterium]|nr:hypothetical protein [bacterium]
TPEGLELLLGRFKIVDCTLEGSLKRPKGIWITARKTGPQEEWGKLPPLRVVPSGDRMMEKVRKRLRSLKSRARL